MHTALNKTCNSVLCQNTEIWFAQYNSKKMDLWIYFSILGDELFSLLEGSVPFREEDDNVVERMGKPSHECITLFAW